MKPYSELQKEWDDAEFLKIFEISVIDKRTSEQDYLIFDIMLSNRTFYAEHIALNKEQEKSDKVAFIKMKIDNSFSLDENLQELLNSCIKEIKNSDFYELPNKKTN